MTLDYFYGQAGELFSFYRIPKALFQEPRFQSLSSNAKTLYGILLDRMSLSAKNGWLDEQGRVFIIFTIEDVKRALCCADNKATKLLRELEEFGLIERKRRGLGKPSLVYVKNFSAESSKSIFQNRDFHDSGDFKSASQDPAKPRCNKTEENNTEMSETYPFYSEEEDGMSKREQLEEYFSQSLEVDTLLRLCPDDEDTIYQIVDLLVDTCATNRKIQNDLMNNFHRLGVLAKPLDGTERLRLMHGMLNMDGANKFHFNWKDLVPSGLSVKDAIAPTALAFKNSRTFQMGGIFGAVSFLNITASDLSDQLLKDFLDMDSSQIVTMHIQSVDQNKAIKTIKHTITELDRSKIEEQKKAVRAGYDMDVLPSDLATYGRDAKALLKELQSQNERMFLVTFLVLNTGKTEQELETNVFQAVSIAQKHNCELCRLDFQQEQGLMSSLPLADCQIEIQRGLTTSSTAIFVPFTTQELFDNGKESLYYGLNALSNNLIMVDRKKLKNPNGLILGTPGSGKSFSAKREICNAFLVTDDDIIIADPEAEYAPLVERLHGQVIHISPASTQYINPMDINSNYSEEDNPLALKADFVLSLCELVVGGKEGLQPVEKTVIDRCVHVIYRKYFENPTPENMPLLEDLYNALLTQDEPEARHVAAALEIYVKGSLNIFNHHTNVDINNRIVCFDIKQLGKQLKKLGMLIVQDAVWGRVTANRSAGKSTRYYADEFHLLLKEEQTAAYSVEIWKRFRKWGGIPTALTQNVKDLLASPEVSNIFENSDFVYMLNQANGDRQILAKQLNISPHQLSYVTHSGEGEGLLFFGNVILPFVDHFPKDLELYRILTTRLSEVAEAQKHE